VSWVTSAAVTRLAEVPDGRRDFWSIWFLVGLGGLGLRYRQDTGQCRKDSSTTKTIAKLDKVGVLRSPARGQIPEVRLDEAIKALKLR
jgi:hypothetical protein